MGNDLRVGVVFDQVVFPSSLTHWAERVRVRLVGITDDLADIDLLLDLGGHRERGLRITTAALQERIRVITANTDVMATHGPGLARIANKKGTAFCFSPAVARRVPEVDRLMKWCRDERVIKFETILSEHIREPSTAWFEEMPFREDPHSGAAAANFDGRYCAEALATLAQLVWRQDLRANHVFRLPASSLTTKDVRMATAQNERWCMFGVTTADGCARVEASRLPTNHALFSQDGPAVFATAASGVSKLFSAGPGLGWKRVMDSVTNELAAALQLAEASPQ